MSPKKITYAKLVLRGRIPEDRMDVPFFSSREQMQFREVVEFLAAARKHRRVKTVLLVVKPVMIGWAQIEEIHRELDALHRSGKDSVAFLETADNHSYFLACGAQRIYMPPTAPLDFVGLRAELHFFKKALDSVGISSELFNIGEFKSAAEIFTRDSMSEEAREMTEAILEDMQSRIVEAVARARRVDVQTVLGWLNAGPHTATAAHQFGMIDGLLYEDDLETLVRAEAKKAAELPLKRLLPKEGFLKRAFTFRRPRIGFLVAEGLVTQGQTRHAMARKATVGSDTLREFLLQARKSKRVKAIVLRVNSPGGAALASDLIWNEVRLTNSLKPVVVSFSTVAASGAYYLSVPASRVFALPSTLTGSIGVIGGKFSAGGLLNKLGIGVSSVDKGSHSGYLSSSRAFSPDEAETVRRQMNEFYEVFVRRVAEGRGSPVETIETVARGRVWTGNQALKKKLVDEIGGLTEAFSAARKLAGIPESRKTRITQYTQKKSLKDFLSLPFLESLSGVRLWAVIPFHWLIR